MERSLLFFILFITVVIGSCSPTSNLLIERIQFKQGINNMLIIPVYTNKELIPLASDKTPGFNLYSSGYRARFYNMVNNSKKDLHAEVIDIFENSLYTVKTVQYKGTIDDYVARKKQQVTFDSYVWDHNYVYYLDRKVIQDLVKEYKVDAVLFHFLQVMKLRGEIDKNLYGPYDSLNYYSYIYDKSGSIIYENNREQSTVLLRLQKYIGRGILFLHWKTRAIPVSTLKKRYTKEKLRQVFRNNFYNVFL